jgi:sugar lactone lactonase YvrE
MREDAAKLSFRHPGMSLFFPLAFLGFALPHLCGATPCLPETPAVAVAGTGEAAFSGDGGPALQARLNAPSGLAFDASGALFISDTGNNRIRKLAPDGTLSTVAGNGAVGFGGDGGPAIQAKLNAPAGIAVDARGNLYFADRGNHRIRKVTPKGDISTAAGNGEPGFSGDGGPAIQAGLNAPSDVAVNAQGELFIADSGNYRIRKVDKNGLIASVAGNGATHVRAGLTYGDFAGDGGPATEASFNKPSSLAFDAEGNLFLSDGFYSIRKVSPQGIISTVAGRTPDTPQGLPYVNYVEGDGGPALAAMLKFPSQLAVDRAGDLWIAEPINVRKINAFGIIVTIAGYAAENEYRRIDPSLQDTNLRDVAVDARGGLYFAGGNRLWKIDGGAAPGLVAGEPFPGADAALPLPGDLDRNGVVDLADARTAIQETVSGSPSDRCMETDANEDGSADLPDALLILRKAMGL